MRPVLVIFHTLWIFMNQSNCFVVSPLGSIPTRSQPESSTSHSRSVSLLAPEPAVKCAANNPTPIAPPPSGESGSGAAPRSIGEERPPTRTYKGSHHGYAQRTLEHFTVNGWTPVYHNGELFVLNKETAIWEPLDREELHRTVAEVNDGKRNCTKWSDYDGIVNQLMSIARDDDFFDTAPVGVACSGSFYTVNGDVVDLVPLEASHRQRVMLDIAPQQMDTPMFYNFMHQTFRSDVNKEEEEQQRLVQEIAGAVLLGVMPRYQKAVLFYDPLGRAGKGTLERIISRLVPDSFISAVSPFEWKKEYYVASLKGSRLNVVGELPEGESIPAASFKSVLGGDLIAGRQPSKPVVKFRNEAAHIFTSNHLITTRDHSEALFVRWLLVNFPNSLLKTGGDIDTGLADRIIAQEMPGIAWWALQGGIRLLQQGKFSSSVVHDQLMQKWRRSASSIDEFIHECCQFGDSLKVRRSSFNSAYKDWCHENGRKAHSSRNVKSQMESRVGLKVRFVLLDGHETIRGLSMSEAYMDRQTSM